MYKLITSNPTVRFNVLLLNGYKDFNEALIKGADLKELVKVSKTMSAIDFILIRKLVTYLLSNRVNDGKTKITKAGNWVK